MSYRYKKSWLEIPPPPPPLPSGSVYSNPGYPCAAFADAAGNPLNLTFNELRAILVAKTTPAPNVPHEDLQQAFRDTIRLVPHTHSDVTVDDVAVAFGTRPSPP